MSLLRNILIIVGFCAFVDHCFVFVKAFTTSSSILSLKNNAFEMNSVGGSVESKKNPFEKGQKGKILVLGGSGKCFGRTSLILRS